MKHAGKATGAALKLIYWTLFGLLALALGAMLARILAEVLVEIVGGLCVAWVLLGLFCFYFFRDPNVTVPSGAEAIVAPACGKVDVIEEADGPPFIGGRCRRLSIFLSIFDVHVQRAPVAGRVLLCEHTKGQFLNAMRTDSAAFNENVLIGFESSERAGEKIAMRLIAGVIARRIVVWTFPGEPLERGDRVSLIQFGSRCDLYLPLTTQVQVRLGQHVAAGQTIVATRA